MYISPSASVPNDEIPLNTNEPGGSNSADRSVNSEIIPPLYRSE